MAVIKLKFTKSRTKIKAHIRYITHRPDRDGERQTRRLFDRGEEIKKEDAYRLIDQAPRDAWFYKLVISPDPKIEDIGRRLDLWQIAKHTVSALEERLQKRLAFVGVEHNDHSSARHMHLVFTHAGKLSRADILALRQAATEASGGQLKERERFQEQTETRALRIRILSQEPRHFRRPRAPIRLLIASTRYCGVCQTFTTQLALPGDRQFCQNCHRVLDSGLTLRRSKEAEWER